MGLYLDHALVLCDVGAPEARVLLEQGFVEGSRNVHAGQGTANRRFFFENFMLELAWVDDPAAAASDAARTGGLWERWSERKGRASPFGVIFGGELPQDREAPFSTRSYRPAYMPPGVSVEVVQGLRLSEPAVFWIPALGASRPTRASEPVAHTAPVREIVSLSLGMGMPDSLSDAAMRLRDAGLLEFVATSAPVLEIRFRSNDRSLIDCRPDLPVVFRAP